MAGSADISALDPGMVPSHSAPGYHLKVHPQANRARRKTAAAANCRSARYQTESVRPTSRRYCPLDPTALCGFTQNVGVCSSKRAHHVNRTVL